MKKIKSSRQFSFKEGCFFLLVFVVCLLVIKSNCFAYPRDYYCSTYRKYNKHQGINFEIDYDDLESQLNLFLNRKVPFNQVKPVQFKPAITENNLVLTNNNNSIFCGYFKKKSDFKRTLDISNKSHSEYITRIKKSIFQFAPFLEPQKIIFEDSDCDGIGNWYDKTPQNPNKS
ncbi:MAG: hypothetical protein P9L96_05735 [Candidatus Gygaella obscura]|nr:hypothetical protein [Candidatus Gygaella obscura]